MKVNRSVKVDRNVKANRRNDIRLIILLLFVAVAGIFLLRRTGESGEQVIVSIGGEKFTTLSLQQEGEFSVGEHNVFLIKEGTVSMKSADCPDQICVHHVPITKQGEMIVCLPNQVVIEIQ